MSDAALLIEPFGGLAGDMFLAALLDLDDPRFGLEDLRGLARVLVPGECALELAPARRGSIAASRLEVRTDETERAPHRHLADCLALLERAPRELFPERARARATAVLRCIARAEARVHGISVERVHFHEVGAVDTLVDVCGAALALERLESGRVVATPPLVGSGTVRCAHGEMPVPAPGTAEILRGLPQRLGGQGERVTPTGAALYAVLADEHDFRGSFTARRTGYGAGTRDPQDTPNLVRVQLGAVAAARVTPEGEGARPDVGVAVARGAVWQLAFNLDDLGGEAVGHLVSRLRAAGALECWTQPVHMKKDRPGVVVEALCRGDARAALEREAFAHSGTLGVRWWRLERTECERTVLEVEVHGQAIRVKRRLRAPGAPPTPYDLKPEHDDLVRAAERTGVSPAELARLASESARARI